MDDELSVVFVSQGPLAAEVALSKLESEGVRALLRYEAIGRVLGLTVDGLGKVEVLVAASDAARAQEILADLDDPDSFEGDAGAQDDSAKA